MATRKRSKYGVDVTSAGIKKRTSIDYITGETLIFDSELEKRYYEDIIVKGMKDKTITTYKLQQKYKLTPSFKYQGETIREINYISDFDITYPDGSLLVVDTKGLASADAKIKRKLMHYFYPNLNFIWMAYTVTTGWVEYDKLQKIRRDKKKQKATK